MKAEDCLRQAVHISYHLSRACWEPKLPFAILSFERNKTTFGGTEMSRRYLFIDFMSCDPIMIYKVISPSNIRLNCFWVPLSINSGDESSAKMKTELHCMAPPPCLTPLEMESQRMSPWYLSGMVSIAISREPPWNLKRIGILPSSQECETLRKKMDNSTKTRSGYSSLTSPTQSGGSETLENYGGPKGSRVAGSLRI